MTLKRTCLVIALGLGFAHSIFLPTFVKASDREGTLIKRDDKADVYTLPQRFQTVLIGNDKDLYAVEYYITTSEDKEALGISLKQWVDENSGVEEFFNAWYGEENKNLAKSLSEGYSIFASENELLGVSDPCTNNQGIEADGALCLNKGSNGGGFIYSGWENVPPNGAENRPNTTVDENKNGLVYYWNGRDYFTWGGKVVNRIQAFGGCAVNTIKGDVSSSQLVGAKGSGSDGARFCVFDGKQVSSSLYAPVFEGGALEVDEVNPTFAQNFYIAEEGGEINNSGFDVTFSGEFTDHLPSPTRGDLIFSGSAITTLSGTNDYDGQTIVKQGTLRIVNPMGLGSIDGGTTVQKDAQLIFNLNGVSNTDRAVIHESIVLDGGVLGFDGKHLILGAEASLELIADSRINVTKESKDVYIFVKDGIQGAGNLIKVGDGTLLLNAPSSGVSEQRYKGDTLVREGVLNIDNNTSLPSTTDVEIDKGATLRILSTINRVQSLSGAGDLVLRDQDAAFITTSSNGKSFAGVISGEGSFAKTGSAGFFILGDNVFRQSGATTVANGLLDLGTTFQSIQSLMIEEQGKVVSRGSAVVQSLAGAGDVVLQGHTSLMTVTNSNANGFSGLISGDGSFVKTGSGDFFVSADNTFQQKGATTVKEGRIRFGSTLQEINHLVVKSHGSVATSGTLRANFLGGQGELVLDDQDAVFIVHGTSFQGFSGKISGEGAVIKNGGEDFLVSTGNVFLNLGDTTIEDGALHLGNTAQDIQSLVVGKQGSIFGGDLVLNSLRNLGQMRVGSLTGTSDANLFENYGSIQISSDANINLKAGNDTLITSARIGGTGVIDGGEGIDRIVFATRGSAAFRAEKIRNFEQAEQIDGIWDYDGDYKATGIKTMTVSGGSMHLTDQEGSTFENFVITGGEIYANIANKNYAPLVADKFDYQGGRLVISAVNQVDPEGIYKIIDSASQEEMNELAANSELLYDDTEGSFSGVGRNNGISGTANYDVYLQEGSLQLVVSKKSAEDIVDCLEDPDRCDVPDNPIIDPIIEPDQPWKEVIDDIIDNIELPIINYGPLAKLLVSGLAPRNIDGPGRGMATYNNLLTDALFERLPLRQFDSVVIEETFVEEDEALEENQAPPVRGLWSKSGEVSHEDVQQLLNRVLSQSTVLTESTTVEELEEAGVVEYPSTTAQYARRDGVRAWFRAFGGDDRDSYNDNFYNPYYVNSVGGVVGVDVSLSESFQIGGFVNYGSINLIQQNAYAGGGSWNSDGWGGGVRADYWTNNFYLQGLFSATGFSGNHKRDIIAITADYGDETASGNKSATSYGLAFRVGAPLEVGAVLIEPQFTTTWSFNNESRFTESGSAQLNLTYNDRSTTYVQTDLAVKFAYPFDVGETSELVPSLRVGWLGDWSGNLSDQSIGYQFGDEDVSVKSANKDTNGLLLEAGLDYTIANINSSSYKVYVRGGIEAWDGSRGTDYRASGGFEWQF